MANQFDVHVVTAHLGEYKGATELPLVYVPAKGGGITILDAQLVGTAAGTVIGGQLVKMTDAGTPAISGTIGAFAGTVVTAAGVPAELTIATAFVDDGNWIGFDQTSGTVPAGTFINIAYVTGKAA
jgi:hypothetical protein